MDWHQIAKPSVPLPEPSLSFFHSYNNHPYPAQTEMTMETEKWLVPATDDHGNKNKKRLTRNQIEVLEMSFLEKMKRTRWKNKQIEQSYSALKHEYDVILKENQKLQEEIMASTLETNPKGYQVDIVPQVVIAAGHIVHTTTGQNLKNQRVAIADMSTGLRRVAAVDKGRHTEYPLVLTDS
ncbi:hypothetical protein VNO78_26778 [Psophocarpus tetragonolobus]|uniref:Homeobox-leucine zipper protein n=1 Tax=Psophocarpus tetragonolobus TaxID=3891 RepID=A0AAN9X8Y0_PSOTE